MAVGVKVAVLPLLKVKVKAAPVPTVKITGLVKFTATLITEVAP